MVRGINKTDIFKDDRDKALFLERLGRNVLEGKCFIYAIKRPDIVVEIPA